MPKIWCRYDNDGDGDCHIHRKGCYRELVSLEMLKTYGITWDDACGEDGPLHQAELNDQSPTDFVSWWGKRYGLIPKEEW